MVCAPADREVQGCGARGRRRPLPLESPSVPPEIDILVSFNVGTSAFGLPSLPSKNSTYGFGSTFKVHKQGPGRLAPRNK